MSETTPSQPQISLTLADVVKPQATFSEDVIGRAVKEQHEAASKSLSGFAGTVLSGTRRQLTELEQRKVAIEAELKKLSTSIDRINKAVRHAQSTNNVFALAATVGQKAAAICWCQANGVVVPANDDPSWAVPE